MSASNGFLIRLTALQQQELQRQ